MTAKAPGGWKHDRRSRHERGYGSAWVKLRDVVMRRDRGLCQPCLAGGLVTPATEVDHITPKANGGTDDEGNLQAICGPCHEAKTKAEHPKAKAMPRYDADGWPVWE